MIVVSDTGPLNYLVTIDAIEVLHVLYEEVLVPAAVRSELLAAKAPERVRALFTDMPGWLVLAKPPSAVPQQIADLGEGEREAISIAMAIHGSLLPIDDQEARRRATHLGLMTLGTLGVLRDAHAAKLLDAYSAFERLQGTSFRVSAGERDRFLASLT